MTARIIRKSAKTPYGVGPSSYAFGVDNAAPMDHSHQYVEPRIALNYQGGWTTFSAFTRELSLIKVGNLIKIEGVIKHSANIGPGATPLTIANIPPAYRPSLTPIYLLTPYSSTSVVTGVGAAVIDSLGDLRFRIPDWATMFPAPIVAMHFETAYYLLE